MAKKTVRTASRAAKNMDSNLAIFVIVALALGFIGGFFFARDRYIKRIQIISEMNMNKAVQIDDLLQQMKVLGASDHAEK